MTRRNKRRSNMTVNLDLSVFLPGFASKAYGVMDMISHRSLHDDETETMESSVWTYDDGTSILLFHGGCHDCTQQLIHGIQFCDACQYRRADWDKPNLNNNHIAIRLADIRRVVREEIQAIFAD